ncbi:MAG TPA: methionine--tRNA ligase [Candidatus Moranbacteria bacterium]|nr:methionine--tRNA ligase [Candidatus Moranbacteria bacterium]
MNKFYITTPIYYVNAKPHIGHAYTTIAADVLARFYRQQLGKENVFFLTGTDEHGQKIQKVAESAGKNPQEFTDEIVAHFKELWDKLDIKYDNFIRTTDESHKKAVQKVLQTLYDNGAIYKGEYEGLYCIGCEQFKNESDLVDGKCPDHNIVPELIKEESYLLKLTELQPELIKKIESDEFKLTPEKYKKEILSFLKNQTLRDVSISRKNVSWGIPLPFDPTHTTYVWADAFLNYLTGLDWDGNEKKMPKFWPADVQLIGKDILRVHATIWPAMLMHLGVELPKILFTHGHILSGGKKMSKTLGNAILIDEMLEIFGTDGTRYLLLSAGTFGEDVDATMERLVEKYNADLANGLGNLVSRTLKLSEKISIKIGTENHGLYTEDIVNNPEIGKAIDFVWNNIKNLNKYIEDNKPWELAKTDTIKFEDVMNKLVHGLYDISEALMPFMPETSEKIKKALETKESVALFPRIK